jgi:hypothetical protein
MDALGITHPWLYFIAFVVIVVMFYCLDTIFRKREFNKRKAGIVYARVVCAANRLPDGTLLLGVRHWDTHMHAQFNRCGVFGKSNLVRGEQGFIDSHGNFLTRLEAWVIAETAGQIVKRVGNDGPERFGLFSENLY